MQDTPFERAIARTKITEQNANNFDLIISRIVNFEDLNDNKAQVLHHFYDRLVVKTLTTLDEHVYSYTVVLRNVVIAKYEATYENGEYKSGFTYCYNDGIKQAYLLLRQLDPSLPIV